MNRVRSLSLARTSLLLGTLALPVLLAACNTVKGAGKDLQYAGEKTEEVITGEKDGTNPDKR
ncbi:MAG: entericidin [Planctomycetota bacterium]|nr:entericidin [Planctomycetota bacterium]